MSDKTTSREKTTLIGNEIFSNEFFSIKQHSNILQYDKRDPIVGNIDDPIIVKYRNHPSILAIGEVCNRGKEFSFAFSQVDRAEVLKQIASLDILKASQDTDIPRKVIKDASDIFADFLVSNLNCLVSKSTFSSIPKQANISPAFKKGDRNLNSLHSKTGVPILPTY